MQIRRTMLSIVVPQGIRPCDLVLAAMDPSATEDIRNSMNTDE